MSPTLLLAIAAAIGLYMAWNIGANDVANAMGTSVGSRALTLRDAIIMAGILELAGAVIVGANVTNTVRKGIVDAQLFAHDPTIVVHGMIAALAGAALWLNVASYLGWPVSTTHSIVGAVAGFGLVAGGPSAIKWSTLLKVMASWVVSPVTSGLIAFGIYTGVRRGVMEAEDPAAAARRWAPALAALLAFVICLVLLFKGLKNLKLGLSLGQSTGLALGLAALTGIVARLARFEGIKRENMSATERIFGTLQVATAAAVAFAHGANDVANAVGPMAAVYGTLKAGTVTTQVDVPLWILMGGGIGIVLGLATYGYRVMATIGGKITEMSPSRGFAAEFGAAVTIMAGSKLGLPLSTTHTLVGSVIGVGLARGTKALNLGVIRSIAVSWVLTIPFAAAVAVAVFYVLRAIG